MPPTPNSRRARRVASPSRRVPRVVAPVLLLVALGAGGSACRHDDADANRRVQVLVVERIVPQGKIVAAAAGDGSLKQSEVPADVAPDDAVTDVSPLRCLVAAQSLPRGTILRRSMLVEPKAIGLDKGLTDGTTRPQGCD
jgi:hypothetical protein